MEGIMQGSSESPDTIKRLSQMLLYYGESQSKFGKRFNLDQSYLSTILNGRRKISGTVLKAMAKQDIDIKWLLTGEGEMFIPRASKKMSHLTDNEIVKELSDLKDDLIKSLKQQVEQMKKNLEASEIQMQSLENDLKKTKEQLKIYEAAEAV